MRIMGIIPIDATTIGQIPLNMLWRNGHDLCLIAHNPYCLHAYKIVTQRQYRLKK